MKLLLLVLVSCQCASVTAQQEYIINGQQVVDIRLWPWQGALHDTWGGDFVCGCTLIDSEWAVTAASCVQSPPYYVSFGSTDRDGGTRRHVKEIKIADNYTSEGGRKYADIAVLHIDPFVLSDSINIVKLGSVEEVNTANCHITGWGYTFNTTGNGTAGNSTTGNSTTGNNTTGNTTAGYDGYGEYGVDRTIPQMLHQGKVRIESKSMCEWFIGPWIHEDNVCTGPSRSSVPQSTCQGDEGGPLVCSAHGGYLLVGVTSWQSADCTRGYSVYTRVSSFIWWIGEMTGWKVADAVPVKLPNGHLRWH